METFTKESEFEDALVEILSQKGWEKEVLMYPTEEDLLQNWANILYDNNRHRDRLNNYPLTEGEMQQILEQIITLRTPLKLNGFINGKTVSVTRDNPDDVEHLGKEISLKIYDRQEIAAGQSRYQIARQPQFSSKSKILNDRRGDLLLLINGMPVIHIELKKSGIPVSQACHQIEKYAHEGIFTGLFSLVQVFVAMEPEETRYFANPGPEGRFNSDFYFHWADFNNEPIHHWKQVATSLLSIPMAHQLIGFYTVADEADGVLKVMRSYQYHAANRISDRVAMNDWNSGKQRGGYIAHTTGSGKTMTSFKSAQLIANSKDADKVVFLMDRIELGTQSLREYRAFADDAESIQETEDTVMLITKLKSDAPADTLIVTSIQKMSNIKEDADKLRSFDIKKMAEKRIVFIIDEAHRSTFGDMLLTIKNTFPNALFFGFTGTPIYDENQKKFNTTSSIFGDELHRYLIGDGIRDKNVLGFDPDMVLTFRERDLREAVALEQAKAKNLDEVLADQKKSEIYYKFMDSSQVPMAGNTTAKGEYKKGIEDYIPNSQYEAETHQKLVVEDICNQWKRLSRGKFHAIFATSSIPEAIQYYRLLKEQAPNLKCTAVFDPTIDNHGGTSLEKEDGIVEMLTDYNERYGQDFSMASYAAFKKDVSARMAHKRPYERIAKDPDQQVDIMIVVNQMLTGFDSKWVNTLYLDKMLEYENLIQAFSRTNRLFHPKEKPFGIIRYYRRPYTMKRNIEDAVRLYSGNRSVDLFVEKLDYNLQKMNEVFSDISYLFAQAGIPDFEKVPEEKEACAKFAKLFKQWDLYIEAAKIQGFRWDKKKYLFSQPEGRQKEILLQFDERTYQILLLRYKELFSGGGGGTGTEDVPYEIEGYLTEIDTGVIDDDYMNSRFEKYLRILNQGNAAPNEVEAVLNELHKSFASLSAEEQKYANIFLHDVQSGSVSIDMDKQFKEYMIEYMANAKSDQVHRLAMYFGLMEEKLRELMSANVTESNINDFGRYKDLIETVDKTKAKEYFERKEGKKLSMPKVNIRVDKLVREFILTGGFDVTIE